MSDSYMSIEFVFPNRTLKKCVNNDREILILTTNIVHAFAMREKPTQQPDPGDLH